MELIYRLLKLVLGKYRFCQKLNYSNWLTHLGPFNISHVQKLPAPTFLTLVESYISFIHLFIFIKIKMLKIFVHT